MTAEEIQAAFDAINAKLNLIYRATVISDMLGGNLNDDILSELQAAWPDIYIGNPH